VPLLFPAPPLFLSIQPNSTAPQRSSSLVFRNFLPLGFFPPLYLPTGTLLKFSPCLVLQPPRRYIVGQLDPHFGKSQVPLLFDGLHLFSLSVRGSPRGPYLGNFGPPLFFFLDHLPGSLPHTKHFPLHSRINSYGNFSPTFWAGLLPFFASFCGGAFHLGSEDGFFFTPHVFLFPPFPPNFGRASYFFDLSHYPLCLTELKYPISRIWTYVPPPPFPPTFSNTGRSPLKVGPSIFPSLDTSLWILFGSPLVFLLPILACTGVHPFRNCNLLY